MTNMVVFLLAGLGTGAVFATLALGLVVTYKGTGVINFAAGALGVWSGYVYSELRASGDYVFPVVGIHPSVNLGGPVPVGPAVALGALTGIGMGLAVHLLVFRPLRPAPPLAKVVASAGVMLAVQSLIVLRFGDQPRTVDPILPDSPVKVLGVGLPQDIFWLAGTAAVLATAVALWFRYSRTGLGMRAAAENPDFAGYAGLSPNTLAATAWGLSCGAVGFMVVLAAPVTGLNATSYTLFVVPALACALVGRLIRIRGPVIAGFALGAVDSEVTFYSTKTWWPSWASTGVVDAVPFIAVVIVLFLLGKRLPTRDAPDQTRLPHVPRPRLRPGVAVALFGAGVAALAVTGGSVRFGVMTSMAMAVVALSFVVLTGLLGQVSFAQAAFAGIGGFAVSKLATGAGLGFPWAPLLAAGIAGLAGLVVGLPALRIRGTQLAVVTLALALGFEQLVFSNPSLNGVFGNAVPPPMLPGLDLSVRSGSDTARLGFGLLCLTVLALVALAVTNLTRSGTGRRFLAVRSNERAAAAVGISVTGTKLAGFGLSAFIAGLGGTLIGYSHGSVSVASFTTLTGVSWLMLAYLGGITSLGGALQTGALATLGIVFVVISTLTTTSSDLYQLIAAIAVILTAVFNPDGIAGGLRDQMARIPAFLRRLTDRQGDGPDAPAASPPTPAEPPEPPPLSPAPRPAGRIVLRAADITVRYGGLTAVDAVSLQVAAGQIVGLIGANGAGKTTLLDAISGFTPCTGALLLGDDQIGGWAPHRRARAGMARTWQAGELFADLTVAENLAVSADRDGPGALLGDLVSPARRRRRTVPDPALAHLGISGTEGRLPAELSLGEQKLVSLGRALAGRPRVLLLDEPAAGLSTAESERLGRHLRALADREQVGVLLIEHDVALVLDVCDFIYVLDFGRLIAAGPPQDIARHPAVVAAYLGTSTTAREAVPTGGIDD